MISRKNAERWLLALLTFVSLGLFLVPTFILRPFRYQAPVALTVAMKVRSLAPALTLASSTGVLILAIFLWRQASRLARTGIMLAALLNVSTAVMSRLNYFEWMFRPITAGGFVSAGNAHLADDEMVMAIQIGHDARAYPIRQMAYHHLFNDTVEGEPLIVTY